MAKVKYSREHEWISIVDGIGTVGITDYAQGQLGDVVFVELPEVGRRLNKGTEAAVIESVKAASETYAPVSGEITEVNKILAGDPAQINISPLGKGWLFKIALADPADLDDLMDADAYGEYVAGL